MCQPVDPKSFKCDVPYRVSVQNYDLISEHPWLFFIVGTFDQPEVIMQVWDQLKIVLSRTNYKLSEFGQSILVSVAGDDNKQQVETIIKQYDGHILIEDPNCENSVAFSLSAQAPNAQIASEVAHHIELYCHCRDDDLYLRPPWIDADISEQQKEIEYQARFTYAQLMKLSQSEASEMLRMASLLPILVLIIYPLSFLSYSLSCFLGLVTRKVTRNSNDTIYSGTQYGDFIKKIEKFPLQLVAQIDYQFCRILNYRRAKRVLNMSDPRIDLQTVELFLEQSREVTHQLERPLIGYKPVTGATLALGQRLGQIRMSNGCPIAEDIYLTADVGSIQQDEDNLIFDYIGFHRIHEGITVFMLYLCEHRFGDIRYRFFKLDES